MTCTTARRTYGCVYLGMFTSKAMGRTFGGVFIYVLHLEWQKKHKHQSRGVTKLFFNINISKVFCWPVREKKIVLKPILSAGTTKHTASGWYHSIVHKL